MKEVYAFDGGNLEREQKKLSAAYDRAAGEANEVRERIGKVDQVAKDLFTEWKVEIGEIFAVGVHNSSQRRGSATENYIRNS